MAQQQQVVVAFDIKKHQLESMAAQYFTGAQEDNCELQRFIVAVVAITDGSPLFRMAVCEAEPLIRHAIITDMGSGSFIVRTFQADDGEMGIVRQQVTEASDGWTTGNPFDVDAMSATVECLKLGGPDSEELLDRIGIELGKAAYDMQRDNLQGVV